MCVWVCVCVCKRFQTYIAQNPTPWGFETLIFACSIWRKKCAGRKDRVHFPNYIKDIFFTESRKKEKCMC